MEKYNQMALLVLMMWTAELKLFNSSWSRVHTGAAERNLQTLQTLTADVFVQLGRAALREFTNFEPCLHRTGVWAEERRGCRGEDVVLAAERNLLQRWKQLLPPDIPEGVFASCMFTSEGSFIYSPDRQRSGPLKTEETKWTLRCLATNQKQFKTFLTWTDQLLSQLKLLSFRSQTKEVTNTHSCLLELSWTFVRLFPIMHLEETLNNDEVDRWAALSHSCIFKFRWSIVETFVLFPCSSQLLLLLFGPTEPYVMLPHRHGYCQPQLPVWKWQQRTC